MKLCPHCYGMELTIEEDDNEQKFLHCVLCGRRCKLNGNRYISEKRERVRINSSVIDLSKWRI